MWTKVVFVVLVICFIIFNLDLALACIKNRDGCQPDGSQGNCCSGFCHKQPGWVAGYCK